MVEVYGRQKIKYFPLKGITRQDANELRDHLLRRLSAKSVARNLWGTQSSHKPRDLRAEPQHPERLHQLQDLGSGSKHRRQASTDGREYRYSNSLLPAQTACQGAVRHPDGYRREAVRDLGTRLQHCGLQLRLRLRPGGHKGVNGEVLVVSEGVGKP